MRYDDRGCLLLKDPKHSCNLMWNVVKTCWAVRSAPDIRRIWQKLTWTVQAHYRAQDGRLAVAWVDVTISRGYEAHVISSYDLYKILWKPVWD